MRKFAPMKIKLYLPSDDRAAALAKATAEAHTAAVVNYIKALDCSAERKAKLLDSIIKITD